MHFVKREPPSSSSRAICRCAEMRGGAQSGGDPLGMTGSDYAELCDLAPSRWSSRGGGGGVAYHQLPQQQPHHQSSHHPSHSSSAGGHVRSSSSSFEAEDVGVGPYGVNSRIGNRLAAHVPLRMTNQPTNHPTP